VRIPEPRRFAVHDLITVIVRESSENDSKAKLNTEKETKLEGGVSEWPDFLNALDLSAKKPKAAVDFKKEFESDGAFKRSDTFTTRVTARIIDVKPNGLLVLEARRQIRTDKETVSMILTGTCRPQDVAGDNTVQSTVLADLQLIKEHEGELRNTTRKGVLTQVLEGLFAF
jgi:flagellar L-ring protein precursor FlgH